MAKRAFVSSTYQDLIAHRQAVESSLALSGIAYNAMEHFGSSSNPPLKTCLEAVEQSELFIGILGVRYGASPPNSKLSFTEREYNHAITLGIPILMFLIDEREAAIAPQFFLGETADQQQRLRALKDKVQKSHTVTYFKNPDDLARVVLASMIRQMGIKF